MARGSSKVSAAYVKKTGDGSYNYNTDVISWSLVTDQYSNIDVNDTSLTMSDLDVVASAGAYTAGSTLTGSSWVKTASNVVLAELTTISFAANASNPITARCIAFYNSTSAADDVICVVDLTADGTAAVDLTTGFSDSIPQGLLRFVANA